MLHERIAIVAVSSQGIEPGAVLKKELSGDEKITVELFSPRNDPRSVCIESVVRWVGEEFHRWDALVFIGALGICVRAMAPVLESKYEDPAVVNCDEQGRFAQSVLSGHRGGANDLARRVARALGAQPVITTSSDVQGLWSLDILGREQGWSIEYRPGRGGVSMNEAAAAFVNREPTVLLLDVRTEHTDHLERNRPDFVTVAYRYEDIDVERCSLLLAVTPFDYAPAVQTVFYRPKVLHAGMGSEKGIESSSFVESFHAELERRSLSVKSVVSLGTVDFKVREPAFQELAGVLRVPLRGFEPSLLESVEGVPNPSETVFRKVGVHSVAEASSALLAGCPEWVVEKQKVKLGSPVAEGPRHYTFAISMDRLSMRKGRIAIVGAGPGDAGLITLKGQACLEEADLVLYAGSLVPETMTHSARPGALVRSSASMPLEDQFRLMRKFYEEGKKIVRLHTGDPSIYGAIQEQMTWFDEHGMEYEIVPGVSSFQAAAAVLKSQFTIPEKVQTIILARGNGRTPVPEKERLRELARARATMCIFLSAEWASDVQQELGSHYPPDTPVAVCYRLTWPDQQVWRGELDNLADIVRECGKTRTVLLIVGEAIGARGKRSKLYDPAFSHGFREASQKERGRL